MNAAAFLGRDFVLTLLNDCEPAKALRFLTAFHMITNHPISHALMTSAAVDLASDEWRRFIQVKGDYFTDRTLCEDVTALPLSLLAAPTCREVNQLRESGVKPLPLRYVVETADFEKQALEAYRARLERGAMEYEAYVERLPKVVKRIQRFVTFTVYATAAASIPVLGTGPSIAALFYGILQKADIVAMITEKMKETRLSHLVTSVFSSEEKASTWRVD